MAKRLHDIAASGDAPLDSRLSEYSAIARKSFDARSLLRRTGNWPIYAAATGSALAMATGASASLITSGIVSQVYPGTVSVNAQGPTTQLGLGMGSGHSVKIHASSGISAGGPFGELDLRPGTSVKIFFTGANSAKNFGFGSTIRGSHAAKTAEIVAAFFTGSHFGKFVSGEPGFAGLSISAGPGATDYGWIELVFTTRSDVPDDLTVLGYGIDTNPNQQIQAGQIDNGYIPEPGTMELALLASGAAGVLALRRRRRKQS
jgi:hypothetical protein